MRQSLALALTFVLNVLGRYVISTGCIKDGSVAPAA